MLFDTGEDEAENSYLYTPLRETTLITSFEDSVGITAWETGCNYMLKSRTAPSRKDSFVISNKPRRFNLQQNPPKKRKRKNTASKSNRFEWKVSQRASNEKSTDFLAERAKKKKSGVEVFKRYSLNRQKYKSARDKIGIPRNNEDDIRAMQDSIDEELQKQTIEPENVLRTSEKIMKIMKKYSQEFEREKILARAKFNTGVTSYFVPPQAKNVLHRKSFYRSNSKKMSLKKMSVELMQKQRRIVQLKSTINRRNNLSEKRGVFSKIGMKKEQDRDKAQLLVDRKIESGYLTRSNGEGKRGKKGKKMFIRIQDFSREVKKHSSLPTEKRLERTLDCIRKEERIDRKVVVPSSKKLKSFLRPIDRKRKRAKRKSKMRDKRAQKVIEEDRLLRLQNVKKDYASHLEQWSKSKKKYLPSTGKRSYSFVMADKDVRPSNRRILKRGDLSRD